MLGVFCLIPAVVLPPGEAAEGIYDPPPFLARWDLDISKPSLPPTYLFSLFDEEKLLAISVDPHLPTGAEEAAPPPRTQSIVPWERLRLSVTHYQDPMAERPPYGITLKKEEVDRFSLIREIGKAEGSRDRLESLGKIMEPQINLRIEF